MSFRGPKSVKLYHNGELCAEMGSVKATIDLLVLHDPLQRVWGSVRNMYYEAVKNDTSLFGFTFVADPDWESSRAVVATDDETNETFVKDSVNEMGNVIYGSNCHRASSNIVDLCRNGKSYRGLTFKYVNEYDGYKMGYGNRGIDYRKAVQQLDIDTGVVISEFPSILDASQHIWDIGLSNASSIRNIRTTLSACVNGIPSYNGVYLGYRWRFKP